MVSEVLGIIIVAQVLAESIVSEAVDLPGSGTDGADHIYRAGTSCRGSAV